MAVLHRLTSSKSNQTTIPIMPKILPTLKVSKKGLTKSSKSIEILVIPKSSDNSNQKNVGITLDQKLIKTILASAYKTVSITEIKTKNDLVKLVNRKPDLVFSGVKYFTFGNEEIWLNDFLDTNHISYIGSSKNA